VSDPFVAEIRMFGFNFPPKGWAFCNGQIMSISQNTALFALLGTFYGGNGQTTFALPNLQGNTPLQQGQSTTGTLYDLGQMGGSETITLLQSEMPFHNHTMNVSGDPATEREPPAQNFAAGDGVNFWNTTNPTVNMNPSALSITGGSLPHNNMQQYLTVNFCIALQGIFPPRG
jgi:microcystin-dependent protein